MPFMPSWERENRSPLLAGEVQQHDIGALLNSFEDNFTDEGDEGDSLK
jgi:hypothetical protein